MRRAEPRVILTARRCQHASSSTCDQAAEDAYCLTLAESMKKILKCGCYYGSITAGRAELMLRSRPDGSFLFRDSRGSLSSFFSITYKTNGVVNHSRIGYFKGRFCLGSANALLQSDDMQDFVNKIVEASRKGDLLNILEMPRSETQRSQDVKLLYPFRRSNLMPKLKELCRIVIRAHIINDDYVRFLPIPFDAQKYVLDCTFLYSFCPYIQPLRI
ncbi:unnamed protein product [Bursaphelenchus xylophilus]|uniref:(pine wood nematode) hypothetical protein n=1 Tax=Bursaphelenchus xylophilus TaxID=6326 RepID=A0A1I7S8W8_BURXY|nr:unnamed protein product [Bursaphelenchus xylophilus]CAG9085959.1 unnamed protein product [Bursaphelenchus xylophilus]